MKRTQAYTTIIFSLVFILGCQPDGRSDTSEIMSDSPVLVVDPYRPLLIESGSHQVDAFDRNRYFRTYHFPGLYSGEINDELRTLNALPGRGTGPTFNIPGDPMTDSNSGQRVGKILNTWSQYALRAQNEFPGLDYAMAGKGMPQGWSMRKRSDEGDVDSSMQIVNTFAVAPEYYDASADLIIRWLSGIDAVSGMPPVYYSAVNEPDSSWKLSGDRVGTFIDYHRAVTRKLKEARPELRITGPCTAWGYPKADFSRWENGWEGRFIDEAGDTVDAYDFHFYSKGYWAFTSEDRGWRPSLQQEHPSLIVSQKEGVGTVWEFGRLDAFLDMVATRHMLRWKESPPAVIISEFGRQGISQQLGPWENEFKSLLYMNTVVRMWMTFFDRPEVELTVPFILPHSDLGYGSQRGQAMYTRPNSPDDNTLVETPFVRFYDFFKDLNGERVESHWQNYRQPEGIQTLVLREEGKLYVLIHNAAPFGTETSVGIRAVGGADFDSAQSIRWEGPLPERVDPNPVGVLIIGDPKVEPKQIGDLTQLRLHGEETLLVTWTIDGDRRKMSPLRETWYYTPMELKRLNSGEWLSLDVPSSLASATGARELVLGIARPQGFEQALIVSDGIGGQWKSKVDLSASKGVENYQDIVRVMIPDVIDESVIIMLEDGGVVTSAKWVVLR